MSKKYMCFLTFQIRRTHKYRFLLIKTRFLNTSPDPADPSKMEHELRLATHQQRAGGQDDGSLNKLPQINDFDTPIVTSIPFTSNPGLLTSGPQRVSLDFSLFHLLIYHKCFLKITKIEKAYPELSIGVIHNYSATCLFHIFERLCWTQPTNLIAVLLPKTQVAARAPYDVLDPWEIWEGSGCDL